jgi:hypothetical protein
LLYDASHAECRVFVTLSSECKTSNGIRCSARIVRRKLEGSGILAMWSPNVRSVFYPKSRALKMSLL